MSVQPAGEVPLLGGTANRGRVHRVGDTVRRPLRPTAPATHALLRHLERVGFDGAPRILGIDRRGREVLSYVHGTAITAPAPAWALTEGALRSVGELLRRFHDAVADFDPSPYTWPASAPAPYSGGTITHNDPNLDNVVFRDGRAVALIDFDLAAPGSPVWDVAGAARLWAPLRAPVDTDDSRRGHELQRLRVLVDAYGETDRDHLADAVVSNHEWMCELVRDGARRGVPGFAAYWTGQAQQRADRTRTWLAEHFDAMHAALT
jgi:hypothetical protein